MKRSLYVSLLTIMYFSACQGSEELEQSQEKEYTVSIMARIGSPDKPGGLSIQLCKSEKKEFYIRYSS